MKKIFITLSLLLCLTACKNTRDYTIEEINNMTPPLGGVLDHYKDIPYFKEQRTLYIQQRDADIALIEKYGSDELKNSDEYKQLVYYWNGLIELTDKMIRYEVVNVLDPIRLDKYIEQIEFYKKSINAKYFENVNSENGGGNYSLLITKIMGWC